MGSPKKLTVLQVVPDLDAGGAERSAVEVASALVADGGRAIVASTGGRLVAELEASGAEFVAMPVDTKNPLLGILNERLAGHTLREIRASCYDRLRDVIAESSDPLMRLLLDSADQIFTESREIDRIQISPTQNILRHPEFADPEQLRGIVELIENEEMVIHLLDARPAEEEGVEVTIGREHEDERLMNYSLITTRYKVGTTTGTIGLIGPKRMNYSKMITLVGYIAQTITNNFQDR